MRRYLLLSMMAPLLLSCALQPSGAQLRGVRIVHTIPQVLPASELKTSALSFTVIYKKDMSLYRVSYRFDSANNGHVFPPEQRRFFFVAARDSTYGLVYHQPPRPGLVVERKRVDSTLWSYYPSSQYDSLVGVRPDSVVDGREMRKVFQRPADSSHPEAYTLTFFYSHDLVDIPYSLSKMDNVAGMKLYRICLYCHGAYYPAFKTQFPPRTLELKIERMSSFEPGLMDYFEDYEKRKR
ncbi:MAG: hypothetical protein JWP27_1634 [Flaviaesturariibacter sp.]|nr:hypothetical protein [Flaviaesturariibacter sp.]